MTFFAKSYVDFFKNLAKNNTTAWFDDNRATYETAVKAPFAAFTAAMIERIAALDDEVKITAKDAISRINRDTRFSKDKSPYNTHLSAAISKYGRKNKEYPGILFQVSHAGVGIFGGAYAPEPESLAKIRALIAKDGKGFTKAITGKAFVAHFGELRGEAIKRIPPELAAAAAKEPRILQKQFFYEAHLPAAAVTSKDLGDQLLAHWNAAREVNTFLQRAFG